MYISFAEAYILFSLVQQFWACELGFNKLFAYTVYYDGSVNAQMNALVKIITVSLLIGVCCTIFTILMQTFLCLDLILMIRYPFEKKEPRVKKYLLFSLVICVIYFFQQIWLADAYIGNVRVGTIMVWFDVCIYASYAVLFVASFIYTYR